MKKAIIFITISFLCGLAFSQNGEIIYTDFKPGICVDYYPTEDNPMPDVFIDIDHDGTNDFVFHAENEWGRMIRLVLKRKDEYAQNADWKLRMPYLLYDENNYLPILGDTILVGDTIANIEESWYSRHTFFYNLNHHIGDIPHIAPDDHCFISVRKAVDGGYCYGWIDAIIYIPPENQVDDYHIYLTICRMAYCTIPNYPLLVGQTDFTMVEENEAKAFASHHPPPPPQPHHRPRHHHGQRPQTSRSVQRPWPARGHGQRRRRTDDSGHQRLACWCLHGEYHRQGRTEVREEGGEGISSQNLEK